jgi:hypothetical protein
METFVEIVTEILDLVIDLDLILSFLRDNKKNK